MVYLDNAATSLKKPPCVIEAVVRAMETVGNVGRGVHTGSLSAARCVFEAREKIAALFHCGSAERVIFTANATESLNIVLGGLFEKGEHIISTDCEHNSVLRPLHRLTQQGVEVDFVPADSMGRMALSDFARLKKANTRAIVCTHASNLTGNVTDIAAVGTFAHENGLLLILDASQTAGVLPIDMQKMHIDVLCFTGHKSLFGPQGTGGLCIAEGVEIRPWKVGGTGVQSHLMTQPQAYPTRLEAGTLNAHGIAGLSRAVDFILETGMERIHAHETALARRFYDAVRQIPGITCYGDMQAEVRAPIVTLNAADMDASELADILSDEYGIAVRAGAHCAPRLHRALGTEQTGAVRFSFGFFNTEEEVDAAICALREVVGV
ncbi:MAG: aminotransferase class V-fold PLP-dependent enzyme [Oscillospiraceae bacterium]|nr:aminotransferase class V-fold PLP-dependent enzyme [Oscillospiraceae bacterium]